MNTAMWHVSYACTNKFDPKLCGYCIQNGNETNQIAEEVLANRVQNMLKGLGSTPWLIFLEGGEYFEIPNVNKVITEPLVASEHSLGVLSNLNNLDAMLEFLEIAKGKTVSAKVSMHLPMFFENGIMEHDAEQKVLSHVDQFFEKAAQVYEKALQLYSKENMPKFAVKSILVPWYLELMPQIKSKGESLGLKMEFLQYKIGSDPNLKPFPYSDEQLEIVTSIIGPKLEGTSHDIRHQRKGLNCPAGMKYLVALPTGKVYTCHEAIGDIRYELGDLDNGFSLRNFERQCGYNFCSCGLMPQFVQIN